MHCLFSGIAECDIEPDDLAYLLCRNLAGAQFHPHQQILHKCPLHRWAGLGQKEREVAGVGINHHIRALAPQPHLLDKHSLRCILPGDIHPAQVPLDLSGDGAC